MNGVELKLQLHAQCLDFVNQRISFARQAMDGAQASANMEEKSSAGDKYENGRAMAQLERDKAASQVSEAMKMKAVLDKINPAITHSGAMLGSLITTENNNFYISISAGKLVVGEVVYLAISAQSPIGLLLLNKCARESFIFNHQKQTIVSVF